MASVSFIGWRYGANKVNAIILLRESSGLGMKQSMGIIDRVLKDAKEDVPKSAWSLDDPIVVNIPNHKHSKFVAEMNHLGFVVQ